MLPTIIVIIYMSFLFVWFRIRITKVKVTYKDDFEKYMALDRKANLARRKDISEEHFVTPDISRMPLRSYIGDEYKRLISKQESLIKASKLKMIKFDQKMSNTELKSMYGAASLDEITRYEDNYSGYLRAVVNYAQELFERGFVSDAEVVLHEGIEFGSDLTQGYKLLADVYSSGGKKNELMGLLDIVLTGNIWNTALTEKVADYIRACLKNLN